MAGWRACRATLASADQQTLARIAQESTAIRNGQIQYVIIWEAAGPDATVPGQTASLPPPGPRPAANTTLAGRCRARATSTPVPRPTAGRSTWRPVRPPTPTRCTTSAARHRRIRSPGRSSTAAGRPTHRETRISPRGTPPATAIRPDYVGVYIRVEYRYVTGLLGSDADDHRQLDHAPRAGHLRGDHMTRIERRRTRPRARRRRPRDGARRALPPAPALRHRRVRPGVGQRQQARGRGVRRRPRRLGPGADGRRRPCHPRLRCGRRCPTSCSTTSTRVVDLPLQRQPATIPAGLPHRPELGGGVRPAVNAPVQHLQRRHVANDPDGPRRSRRTSGRPPPATTTSPDPPDYIGVLVQTTHDDVSGTFWRQWLRPRSAEHLPHPARHRRLSRGPRTHHGRHHFDKARRVARQRQRAWHRHDDGRAAASSR